MRKINSRWETSLAGVDAEGALYVEDDVLNTSRKVLPMAKNRNDYKKEREY